MSMPRLFYNHAHRVRNATGVHLLCRPRTAPRVAQFIELNRWASYRPARCLPAGRSGSRSQIPDCILRHIDTITNATSAQTFCR